MNIGEKVYIHYRYDFGPPMQVKKLRTLEGKTNLNFFFSDYSLNRDNWILSENTNKKSKVKYILTRK